MNKKILTIVLMSALMLSILVPLGSVFGAEAPNPTWLTVVTAGGPETVDPAWAYDTASAELIQNVLEPLCAFNGNSTTSFIAVLADDWPGYDENPTTHELIPSDPRFDAPAGTNQTWYFHIRSGVEFSDGDPLTGADIEYTFERGMLMDHSGGPQWMFYEPLLGAYGSSDYDLNGGGINETSEYNTLEADIKAAIGSNDTFVWFNLPGPYAPFQQILSQTWGMILSKDYAIAHGCWNGNYNDFTEFTRCYDPPSPGPLMDPAPEILGTGPYTLVEFNTDPDTGWYVLANNTNYWRGLLNPNDFAKVANAKVKLVAEWANRKAQFFSTDPALQADFCAVPRANVGEMHPGGNKDVAPYPGFNLYIVPVQTVAAIYFNYNVSQPSDYTPKLGATSKPDLFSDRNMRLAFIYALNVTKFNIEYNLGEAIQPTTCMPPGTAFYDEFKEKRDIDLAKAQAALDAAWGGQAKSEGITVKLTYNTGNTARETICKMIEDIMEHQLTWGGSAVKDIQPTGVAWSNYLVELYNTRLSAFTLGWLADFPDPHNWFMPFMHSHGDYSGYGQGVIYGLGDISASWPTVNVSYGPPPYTNDFGEAITAIDNDYVDGLIERALALEAVNRSAVYHELMDIYFAEASQQPVYTTFGRHYERSWIHGWMNTWNANPISPGFYFYTISKEIIGTVQNVNIAAYNVAMSPTNNITQYLMDGAWHTSGNLAVKPVPYLKRNGTTGVTASVPLVEISAYVKYYNATGPDVLVLCMWVGITPNGHAHDFGTAAVVVGAGDPPVTFGPKTVSLSMPAVGDYEVYVYCFVLDPYALNINVTKDFDAQWFNATGICDISADLVVDGQDFQLVKRAVGSAPGGAKWRWMADVSGDGIVDGVDYQKVKVLVGKVSYTKS